MHGCIQGHGPDNLCAALVMTESMVVFKDMGGQSLYCLSHGYCMVVFKDMGGQSLYCLSHDYCTVVVKDTDRQALDRLT